MTRIINIIFKTISYLLMLLAAVLIALVWVKGDSALENSLALQKQILDPFMITAYVALGLAIVVTIIFSVVSVAMDPRNALKIVGILIGLVILGFITYSLAGNEFGAAQLQRLEVTEEVSQRVGAALYYTYIVGGLAIIATIYASIAGLFKR